MFSWTPRAGHDGAMSGELPLSGLIVCLEDVGIDDLVGATEVLVQEGFHTFSMPVASEAFAEFTAIYGGRARIGVHGFATGDQMRSSVDQGATFALLDHADPGAIEVAVDTGTVVHVQAMTPTEVRTVLDLPVTGAMLHPADVVGHIMATRLRAMGLVDRVVPRGGLGAYSSGEWLAAGSPAACIDLTLLSDALHGGDLERLRDRCGSFINVQEKHA